MLHERLKVGTISKYRGKKKYLGRLSAEEGGQETDFSENSYKCDYLIMFLLALLENPL